MKSVGCGNTSVGVGGHQQGWEMLQGSVKVCECFVLNVEQISTEGMQNRDMEPCSLS